MNYRFFFFFCSDLLLSDFEFDKVWRIVPQYAAISKEVDDVFRANIIWVEEPAAPARNADSNARLADTFSRCLPQWFRPNNRLRLGSLYFSLMIRPSGGRPLKEFPELFFIPAWHL